VLLFALYSLVRRQQCCSNIFTAHFWCEYQYYIYKGAAFVVPFLHLYREYLGTTGKFKPTVMYMKILYPLYLNLACVVHYLILPHALCCYGYNKDHTSCSVLTSLRSVTRDPRDIHTLSDLHTDPQYLNRAYVHY